MGERCNCDDHLPSGHVRLVDPNRKRDRGMQAEARAKERWNVLNENLMDSGSIGFCNSLSHRVQPPDAEYEVSVKLKPRVQWWGEVTDTIRYLDPIHC